MIVSKEYAVKYKGDKARIYIGLQSILRSANMSASTSVTATFKNGIVFINRCSAKTVGSFRILNTSRGAVLEINKKILAESLMRIGTALVTAKPDLITIVPHPAELKRIQREASFVKCLVEGKPLAEGSLFSGVGLKNLHFTTGLAKAGVKSKILFANDMCEKALDINMQCNPAWKNAGKSAQIVCGDIRNVLLMTKVPKLNVLDISYPCSGLSTLANERDTSHSLVGDLFISVINLIRSTQCALFSIECTPLLLQSDTLKIMKQHLNDYAFKEYTLSSHDHGSIEDRKRVCVIGISKGIRHLLNGLDKIEPRLRKHLPLSTYLDNVPLDSDRWKPYSYARNDSREGLNFKGSVITPTNTKIPTLIATYSCAKRGSPLVRHPIRDDLFRLLTPNEHAKIKEAPEEYRNEIKKIVDGSSHLTNSRGSRSLAHKFLGLSVERFAWEDAGENIGYTLLRNAHNDLLKISC